KAGLAHVFGHFRPATEFVDERLIKPRLIDLQAGIGQQAVAVKALDIVALVGTAIAPDIDVVFLHGRNKHGARYSAPYGRGIEIRDPCRGNMERTTLQRRNAFSDELCTAIDETRDFSAVLQGLARNLVVVRL